MTREERVESCRRCLNRSFDPSQGVTCSLTGNVATFENQCSNYKLDSSVTINIDTETLLNIDQVKNQLPTEVYDGLRLEQNLSGAIIGGLIAAVFCAVGWAGITIATEFQIGYMAILVGAGVGYVMRTIGNGVDPIFGYMGAAISLFGCILGNLLGAMGFVGIANDIGFLDVLFLFDYSQSFLVLSETFHFMDVIFYAIAISTGYRLAMRSVTEQDVKSFKRERSN